MLPQVQVVHLIQNIKWNPAAWKDSFEFYKNVLYRHIKKQQLHYAVGHVIDLLLKY